MANKNPVIDRLIEERKKWRHDPPMGFKAKPSKNLDGTGNLYEWECEVPGPRNTPWEGKTYKFIIEFPRKVLEEPLWIYCTSKVFHPNIDHDGTVCSSLTSIWPECGLKQIVLSLQSFLEYPNPNHPMNSEAARLFKENRAEYNQRVQDMKSL